MTAVTQIPDLRKLHILSELSRRGTLAAVAEALAYSPSAVSQSLRSLEAELGVKLLTPEGRGVRLTSEALILVGRTERALEEMERARSEIANAQHQLIGTVRIAAFQTVMMSLLPRALNELSAAQPGIRVEIVQSEPETALPGLLARDFDLVVAEDYPGQPTRRVEGVSYQSLLRDPMRLVVPTSLTEIEPDSLQHLRQISWVVEPKGSQARSWAVATCRELGFEPDIRYETSDMYTHAHLVESGLAAAFLPDLLWFGRHLSVTLVEGIGTYHRDVVTSARIGSVDNPLLRSVTEAIRGSVDDVMSVAARRLRSHAIRRV